MKPILMRSNDEIVNIDRPARFISETCDFTSCVPGFGVVKFVVNSNGLITDMRTIKDEPVDRLEIPDNHSLNRMLE